MEIGPSLSASPPEMGAPDPAAVRAIGAWVQQWARTLKTCRLYDGENPTVIRFREELCANLRKLLADLGPVSLNFSSVDVLWKSISLYPARSREDNLALPFFRDGIRCLTLQPEIGNSEIEGLLDLILSVTGPRAADEDLVTLLWDAQLPHVDVDYVPTDGDIECGGEGDTRRVSGPVCPWPEPGAAGGDQPGGWGATAESNVSVRSDDWQTSSMPADIARRFAFLEVRAVIEKSRFRGEVEARRQVNPVNSALMILGDCLAASPSPEARQELGQFLQRVLREAIMLGMWSEAGETLRLIGACELPGWSVADLTQELLGPFSVVTPRAVSALDRQEEAGIAAFLEFARQLGPDAVDWLMAVLAESQRKEVRRPLTRIIAEQCRENPARLTLWLGEERWYVVRNVVHILGWIGGNEIAGILKQAVDHAEPRVRQEIVAAAAQLDGEVSRPILLAMLDGAPPKLEGAILHQLAQVRHLQVACRLLHTILNPEFEHRPQDQKRPWYFALGGCASDEIVSDLEKELNRGGLFSRSPDPHRQAMARCLARIASPAAIDVLRLGAESKWAGIRQACQEALKGAHLDG